VAVTLGAYLEDICLGRRLGAPLLIDTARTDVDDDPHPGTNDLDVGLAIALLDERRYAEITSRLRAEGFGPDTIDTGNDTVQWCRLGDLKVAVDFLLPPADADQRGAQIHKLEADFGALITPGLELAFAERVIVELDGYTLKGEHARRRIPVCGPAAFVVLKALASGDRSEPKDAYDLVYVIRHTPGRGRALAERLAEHADRHREIVERALGLPTVRRWTRRYDHALVRAAEGLACLVLDELHTYRGRQGADVAPLVRRVRDACRVPSLPSGV
jgi:hypothetical protein